MAVFKHLKSWTGEDNGLIAKVRHESNSIDGATSYEELSDKPSINGVILQGNTELDTLGVQPKGDYITVEETETRINEALDALEIPQEYITEKELEEKGYLTEHQDLTGYAKTTDVPTKVSQLTNDKNYITSIPEEYVTENELTAKGYITNYIETDPTVPAHVKNIKEIDIAGWNNKSEFSGNYNDLTNKPTIPSTDGLATEEYVTKAIADLIGSAPETLDTLAELAEGLTANRDVVEVLNDAIELKADITYVDNAIDANAFSKDYNDLINIPTCNAETIIPIVLTGSDNRYISVADLEKLRDTYLQHGQVSALIIGGDLTYCGHYIITDENDTSWRFNSVDINYLDASTTNGWLNIYQHHRQFWVPKGEVTSRVWISQSQGDVAPVFNIGAYAKTVDVNTQLESKANNADLSTVAVSGNYDDLSNKPTIPTVPTNISAFTNDKGYITSYTETDPTVPTHVKNITTTDISNWNAKSTFSGDYNDLINKPSIPSTAGLATETYVNDLIASLQNTIADLEARIAELEAHHTTGEEVVE